MKSTPVSRTVSRFGSGGPQVGLGDGVIFGDADGSGEALLDGAEVGLGDGVIFGDADGSGEALPDGAEVGLRTAVRTNGMGDAATSAKSFEAIGWEALEAPQIGLGDGVISGDSDGSGEPLSVGATVGARVELEPGVDRLEPGVGRKGVGDAVASAKSFEAICWAAL
jgi:hypothetical protein